MTHPQGKAVLLGHAVYDKIHFGCQNFVLQKVYGIALTKTLQVKKKNKRETHLIIISCNTSNQCYADYFCGGVTNVNGAGI
jgi:hypothetical protein